LDYSSDGLAMEIQDDGKGFASDSPVPRGHFGLIGMRERANKLRAPLTVGSTPGKGTLIRVIFSQSTHPQPPSS
jgi:signal transduction histidine kinase